jgi:arginine exporter protein ArgO
MRQRLAALVLSAALALPAGAQCVMCYRTAHAQNAARSRVMNTGIFILGAPPFLILAGFVGFVAYKNNKTRDD